MSDCSPVRSVVSAWRSSASEASFALFASASVASIQSAIGPASASTAAYWLRPATVCRSIPSTVVRYQAAISAVGRDRSGPSPTELSASRSCVVCAAWRSAGVKNAE